VSNNTITFADRSTQTLNYHDFGWTPNGPAHVSAEKTAFIYNQDGDFPLDGTVIAIEPSRAAVAIASINFTAVPDAFRSDAATLAKLQPDPYSA
jgi:hypothetical protein